MANVCAANIQYLEIKQFSKIPEKVKKASIAKNCLVPQSFLSTKPHNVVQGHFANSKSQDWAILCSKKGKSSIYIVWEKEKACPSEIATTEDSNYVQHINEQGQKNILAFSRYLSAASKATILKHQKEYGGLLPKSLDHQGIDDSFVEKGSLTYYCEKGKWLTLTGAD